MWHAGWSRSTINPTCRWPPPSAPPPADRYAADCRGPTPRGFRAIPIRLPDHHPFSSARNIHGKAFCLGTPARVASRLRSPSSLGGSHASRSVYRQCRPPARPEAAGLGNHHRQRKSHRQFRRAGSLGPAGRRPMAGRARAAGGQQRTGHADHHAGRCESRAEEHPGRRRVGLWRPVEYGMAADQNRGGCRSDCRLRQRQAATVHGSSHRHPRAKDERRRQLVGIEPRDLPAFRRSDITSAATCSNRSAFPSA